MANARGWIWIAVLVAILLFAARGALDTAPRTNEYAYGCDSFGFLTSAARVREAVANGRLPDFHIETRQTRLLIDDLRSRRVPQGRWNELVAPHAHHYMRRAGRVGVQYPPGTGMSLAVFPAGKAVAGLARFAIGALVVTGLVALLFAGARRAPASAGLVLLTIVLGLDVLIRQTGRSYSMLAVIPPLLIAAALTALAAAKRDSAPRLATLAAFAAGGALGFALLTRIPTALLVPGYALLLWPRWPPAGSPESRPGVIRRFSLGPLLALTVGLVVIGVAPLLLHQELVAGSWRSTTYGAADASPPRAIDADALRYYFGGGEGSGENWALLPAVAGLLAAVALGGRARRGGVGAAATTSTRRAPTARPGLTWPRVVVAAGVIWATSSVFFLTHFPRIPYYNSPGVFAAIAALAFGALAVEASRAPAPSNGTGKRVLSIAAMVGATLALVPAAAAIARATQFEQLFPRQSTPPSAIELPTELADERAWVWADEMTGTFWYYERKPAFKVAFASDQTRAEIFRFVRERGEPQYVVRDSPTLDGIMREIEALGGTLDPRGSVAGVPYFAVRWPARPAAASRN